jgi:hypothetical protein
MNVNLRGQHRKMSDYFKFPANFISTNNNRPGRKYAPITTFIEKCLTVDISDIPLHMLLYIYLKNVTFFGRPLEITYIACL